MDNEIFDASLLNYAQVFQVMAAPLGGYAPRLRLLAVDYKDRDGVDFRQDNAVHQNPDMTDERMVELVREQYARMGVSVSAITELVIAEDMASCRCLWARPGFLEETIRDLGLPLPADMIANAEAVGFHPINWDELVRGWKGVAP